MSSKHGLRNEGAPCPIDGCDRFHPLCTGRAGTPPERSQSHSGVSGSGHAV